MTMEDSVTTPNLISSPPCLFLLSQANPYIQKWSPCLCKFNPLLQKRVKIEIGHAFPVYSLRTCSMCIYIYI